MVKNVNFEMDVTIPDKETNNKLINIQKIQFSIQFPADTLDFNVTHNVKFVLYIYIYTYIYTRIPVTTLPDSSPQLALQSGSAYGLYE